jgi:Ca-activated chloride channel family protein
LQAEGATALYDAIIFSLVQFEETGGRRKALVLLTDGDDYRSQFPRRRCIDYGRQLGVPVYIIALGGVQDPRRGFRRIDLEGITRATGGEVFNISDMSDLAGAYAGIEAELRSQYLITFATDRPLSDGEIEDLVVDVRGKGLTVRAVVGDRRVE